MANQQLQQGRNKEQIRKRLLASGWKEKDIEEMLKSLPPSNQNQPVTQNNKVVQPSPLRLSIFLKIILGIATLSQLLYSVILLPIFIAVYLEVGFLVLLGTKDAASTFISPSDSTSIPYLLGAIFYYPAIILTFVLSLIYITLVFTSKRISKKQKTRWAGVFSLGIFFAPLIYAMYIFDTTRGDIVTLISYLGFFVAIPLVAISLLAMPIYWYRYIWKEPQQNQLPGKKLVYV